MPPRRTRCVLLFDLDGVLADLCALHRECFIHAFNEAHGSAVLDERTHAPLEGMNTRAKLAECARQFGPLDAAAVFARKQELTRARLEAWSPPTHVRDALRFASTHGARLACVSNSIRATLDAVLAKLGVLELLETTVSSDDVAHPKPAPEGYLLALQRLGADAADAVIFEDSACGLAAARAPRAHGVEVLDSLDITAEFLRPHLLLEPTAIALERCVAALPPLLRVVIPMAGAGSRFAREGFYVPKPFLRLPEGPMWEAVVRNLVPPSVRSRTEVHVVVQGVHAEHLQHTSIDGVPVHVHVVPALTEGPACTVLTLRAALDDDVPLLVGNSDQLMEWDAEAFFRLLRHPSYDGAVSTFYHPCPDDVKWSYARAGADGTMAQIVEKRYIGPDASTGIYGWARSRDFVRAADDMIAADDRTNGEFYVAATYNHAIARGLRFRLHNVTRLWGLGVPADFDAYLDRASDLQHAYDAMACKWGPRLPTPQPDALDDPTECAAMWCEGRISLFDAAKALRDALAPVAHKALWYALDADARSGRMHHTLFQFSKASATLRRTVSPADFAVAAGVAKAALARLPPYYLWIRGAVCTKSGVALCGFPPTSYEPVRAELRAAFACDEPHAQNIHHLTLLRWRVALTIDEARAVATTLAAFRSVLLGLVQPTEWHVGYGTWAMRAREAVVSWRAPPSPHVLHRGNARGDDCENEPALLRRRLAEGHDVEVDLWVVGGAALLGHDAPLHPIDDAFLADDRVWVHCKNAAAAAHARALGCHYFVHDRDDATLTSRGVHWMYPGVEDYPPGVTVAKTREDAARVASGAGVCTDFA